MLIRRESYLLCMNYVIIFIISFHLLGLDIFGKYMNHVIGYILFTFIFVYYCYGGMFTECSNLKNIPVIKKDQ